MVMNLDKCIGCHTCSVTCKNVWTNRPGAEYMYFNNVETKPGIGYPKEWENQEKWKGGWKLENGELTLATGSKTTRMLKLFFHPEQPEMATAANASATMVFSDACAFFFSPYQGVAADTAWKAR